MQPKLETDLCLFFFVLFFDQLIKTINPLVCKLVFISVERLLPLRRMQQKYVVYLHSIFLPHHVQLNLKTKTINFSKML